MVKGTVNLNLEDYHALLDANVQSKDLSENAKKILKELQVFLSFLCTRTEVSEYLEEFNRQSKTSTIYIENGRAIIKLKDDKELT